MLLIGNRKTRPRHYSARAVTATQVFALDGLKQGHTRVLPVYFNSIECLSDHICVKKHASTLPRDLEER